MKTNRTITKCIALFMVVTIVLLQSFCVSAYDTVAFKVANKTATYTWGGAINSSSSYSTYKHYWQTAMSNWNSAVGYNISYSSSSANIITIFNEASSSYYGLMTPYSIPGNVLTSFKAEVNIALTGSNEKIFRSVACHELGHTLGLDNTDDYPALMNPSRNRSNIYVPQQDDINGVNEVYG